MKSLLTDGRTKASRREMVCYSRHQICDLAWKWGLSRGYIMSSLYRPTIMCVRESNGRRRSSLSTVHDTLGLDEWRHSLSATASICKRHRPLWPRTTHAPRMPRDTLPQCIVGDDVSVRPLITPTTNYLFTLNVKISASVKAQQACLDAALMFQWNWLLDSGTRM